MTKSTTHLPVIQPDQNPGTPLIFEKIAIVGLGLIGGSIALAARRTWPESLVIGVDNREVLEKAMVHHAIDVAADDPVVMAEADLVILAAPVNQNIQILATLEENVTGTAVVTDVGSTKREIVEKSKQLPERLSFIGGHPLGGAPQAGIDYARPDLFQKRPWIFTPLSDSTESILERLMTFATALGSKPHVMSPSEHDRLLAYLSHLPQLTASTLMHVVGEEAGEQGLSLTGRGLSDTTRLASSPATIWRDICATNHAEIYAALGELIAKLEELRKNLDAPTIDSVFSSASMWRTKLPVNKKDLDQ